MWPFAKVTPRRSGAGESAGKSRLPPCHALPRDVEIPALPGVGITWYDRGGGYWARRVALALMWAVALLLVVLVDVGIFTAIRKSSPAAFAVLLAVDVVAALAVLGCFAVRAVRRWNTPALPGRAAAGMRARPGGGGAFLGGLLQLGYLLAVLAAAVVFLFCPALILAMFVMSLVPEPLADRQAQLWMAERLDRMAELPALAGRGVAVAPPDRGRMVAVSALPGHAAGGFVGQDHAVPAWGVRLGDPFDDPALAPLAADADPDGRVPGAGAPLAPADAGPGSAGVRDAHRCQYPKPCSGSRGRAPGAAIKRVERRHSGAPAAAAGALACGWVLPASSVSRLRPGRRRRVRLGRRWPRR
jgi:hypothetical protein